MPEIPYTVRLAPELLERIEKTARERGISPRKLIRAALAERFASGSGAQQHERVNGGTAGILAGGALLRGLRGAEQDRHPREQEERKPSAVPRRQRGELPREPESFEQDDADRRADGQGDRRSGQGARR